jgi:hypothetical protein
VERYITLNADALVGNKPLDLVFLFIVAFKDSIGLVV